MPKALTEASIQELSIVLKGGPGGGEFAPRNPNARVLVVKGKPSFLGRLTESLKGYFAPTGPGGFPVTEATDNVDNDGDGPMDYNAIVSAICSLYYDLSSCYGIMDDKARSIAMTTAIDGFLDELDEMRAGIDDDSEKAGARHSAADKATLDKLGEHLKAAQDAMTSASEAHASLMPADTSGEEDDDATKAAIVTNGVGATVVQPQIIVNGTIMPATATAELAASIAATKAASLKQPSAEPAATETAKAGEIDMTQEQLDALIASTAQKA